MHSARAGQGLFRPQAVAAQRRDALGEIVIVRPVSFAWLAGAAALVAGAIAGFLVWGTYTQHSTLSGRVVPELGVIKVHTPQPGTIIEKHVVEGESVEYGEVLYLISSERVSGTMTATHEQIGGELERRRASLARQVEHTRALERTEHDSLLEMKAALRAEGASLRRMLATQRKRLEIVEDAAARYERIRAQGFVSEDALLARREALIEQQSYFESLEREHASVERQRADLESRLASLPLEYRNRLAELERALAATRQELAENEVRRHVAVIAPAAGTVTAVVAEVGQLADTSRPLVSIVPAGGTLHAELYAPSRAIGFVEPGNSVLLRYQAYPYQKFGHHRATIEAITRTATPVTELADAPAGGLSGPGEPVYRITLRLPAQTMRAYGREHALQAGMAIEADVLLETRRLYEWVLEPLYTLTGRLHSQVDGTDL